ncbi:MAG TPA: DNA-3-methyladenine glycosylase [Acidisarcina sp.]
MPKCLASWRVNIFGEDRSLPSFDVIPLAREFYLERPDAVAARLLGKLLIRRLGEQFLAGRIVEVEAYFGIDDPAAHAFAGRTERNAVLYGPPGHAYVYFIYGMHYCLNVSCEPDGEAGCVLIRALEPVSGLTQMASLRNLPPDADPRLLTTGPGRLCQSLNITRAEHNGLDLTNAESPLYIAPDGFEVVEIAMSPRIGIRKAADRPLRFSLGGNRFVTRAPLPAKPSSSGRKQQHEQTK